MRVEAAVEPLIAPSLESVEEEHQFAGLQPMEVGGDVRRSEFELFLDASSFSPQQRLRSTSCGMSQALDFLSPYVLSMTDNVGKSPKKQDDASLHT